MSAKTKREPGDVCGFLESMAARHLTGSPFPRMVEVVKPGRVGKASVHHVTITPEGCALDNIRKMRDGFVEGLVCPGKFAVLTVGGEVMMSDTPLERVTNREFIHQARGRVLVAGLGLGMVLHALAAKPDVKEVVVVEIDPDVIAIVKKSIPEAVRIVHSPIEVFLLASRQRPPKTRQRWDTIFLDVWPTISGDDTEEATRLRRLARASLAPGGWVGVWADDIRKREARRARATEDNLAVIGGRLREDIKKTSETVRAHLEGEAVHA